MPRSTRVVIGLLWLITQVFFYFFFILFFELQWKKNRPVVSFPSKHTTSYRSHPFVIHFYFLSFFPSFVSWLMKHITDQPTDYDLQPILCKLLGCSWCSRSFPAFTRLTYKIDRQLIDRDIRCWIGCHRCRPTFSYSSTNIAGEIVRPISPCTWEILYFCI